MSRLIPIFLLFLRAHTIAVESPTPLDLKSNAQLWARAPATLPTLLRILELATPSATNLEEVHKCSPPQLVKEQNGLRISLHPLEVKLLSNNILQAAPLCASGINLATVTFPFARPTWFNPGDFGPAIDGAIAAAAQALSNPNKVRHTYKGRSLRTLLSLVVAIDTQSSQAAALIIYPSPDDTTTSMMVKRVHQSDSQVLERLHPSLKDLPDVPVHLNNALDTPEALVKTFDARVKGAGRNLHDMKAVEELAHALIDAGVGGVEEEWSQVEKRVHQLRVEAAPGSRRALGQESWNELSASLLSLTR